MFVSFLWLGIFLAIILLKKIFVPSLSCCFSRIPIMHILIHLTMSHNSLKISLLLFILISPFLFEQIQLFCILVHSIIFSTWSSLLLKIFLFFSTWSSLLLKLLNFSVGNYSSVLWSHFVLFHISYLFIWDSHFVHILVFWPWGASL